MNNVSFFSEKNINFECSLHGLTEDDINKVIPCNFKGKDFFVYFYIKNNGMLFPDEIYFYRDLFYTVKPDEDNPVNVCKIFAIPDSPGTKSIGVKFLVYM